MYFLAGLALILFALMAIGFRLYRIWNSSTWKNDQVSAILRMDRLIKRLEVITATPGSGLSVADIGDVAADWAPLRSQLSARHSFKSWIEQGRMRHTLDDRFAHALWTLAHKKIKPLNKYLDSQSGQPLRQAAIDEIIDVLSTDLYEEASNVVRLVTWTPRASEPAEMKLSS